MSNRKRNVAFIKPQDPSFLQKLKAEIGYKEGPDIDAKRQKVEENRNDYSSEEEVEREEEKPQVVVLQEGDLTAEEVAEVEKVEREKPADLNQRVIFKSKRKIIDDTTIKLPTDKENKKKSKEKKSKDLKNKLSFNDAEEEDEIF